MDAIGQYVAVIVVSPSSFIPFFIFLFFVTLSCDVSGFQDGVYKKINHEGYGAIYFGTGVSRYKASYP